MEHSAASIEKLVVDRDRRAEGRVVLATPDGVGAYLIAPHVAEFLAENPAIRLALDCGLSPDAPLDARPDIYLEFERPTDPELISEPIAYGHWCIFASQSYVDIYGKPQNLPQAVDHRAVDLTVYGKVNREAWTNRVEAFMNLRTVNLDTNSSAVMFLAVCHGAGVAPLPSYALAIEPDLVMLDSQPMVSMPIWMSHRRDVSHSARIRRVQEWLRSVFDARKKPWFRKEFVHPSEFMDLARSHAEAFRSGPRRGEPETAPLPLPLRHRSSGA